MVTTKIRPIAPELINDPGESHDQPTQADNITMTHDSPLLTAQLPCDCLQLLIIARQCPNPPGRNGHDDDDQRAFHRLTRGRINAPVESILPRIVTVSPTVNFRTVRNEAVPLGQRAAT